MKIWILLFLLIGMHSVSALHCDRTGYDFEMMSELSGGAADLYTDLYPEGVSKINCHLESVLNETGENEKIPIVIKVKKGANITEVKSELTSIIDIIYYEEALGIEGQEQYHLGINATKSEINEVYSKDWVVSLRYNRAYSIIKEAREKAEEDYWNERILPHIRELIFLAIDLTFIIIALIYKYYFRKKQKKNILEKG